MICALPPKFRPLTRLIEWKSLFGEPSSHSRPSFTEEHLFFHLIFLDSAQVMKYPGLGGENRRVHSKPGTVIFLSKAGVVNHLWQVRLGQVIKYLGRGDRSRSPSVSFTLSFIGVDRSFKTTACASRFSACFENGLGSKPEQSLF